MQGNTLGIYVYGRIGSLVAKVGRTLGARVVCWGREGSLARAREAGYETAQNRNAFFAESDILSLHLPLTTETRGIVTAEDLARTTHSHPTMSEAVREAAMAAYFKPIHL